MGKSVYTSRDFKEALSERILVLDGAMGTCIQQYNLSAEDFLTGKGNNDILNLTKPSVIEDIHKKYVEAGADIITTNTFSGNKISQKDYNCQDKVYQINYQGAKIARGVADASPRQILVAGSIGPTVKSLSMAEDMNSPHLRGVSFKELVCAYTEQVEALLDGGVDILLVETVYDVLNCKAALYSIEQVLSKRGLSHKGNWDIPVMVSATVNDKSGRLLQGSKLDALYHAISQFSIASFGLNCSFGAKDLAPFIEQIQWVGCAVSIYPNAGLPNAMGQYDELPSYTAECIGKLSGRGLINIAGGCCGTTPEHIKAVAQVVKGCAPREYGRSLEGNENSDNLYLSGLESLLVNRSVNNFVNVGERTNVAGSAKFARLIREKEYAAAADIARKQIEDGATIIDINMDDAMLDGAQEMENFVRYINTDPDIAKVPYMIDSSCWECVVAGLENCMGKGIVNSISLKEGESEFLRKAEVIRNMGAAVIVMAFDEHGQAVTYERKIEICSRAYDLLVGKVGFNPSDIIFDCNILTVATGIAEHNNYAVDFIKAVKWIKENLQGAKTSGGVSNLSFAFRGNNTVREAMHSVFLYHAIAAGLDMAIVNPSMLQIYDNIEPELLKRVEAVVLNDSSLLGADAAKYDNATEALVELAGEIKQREIAAKEASGGVKKGQDGAAGKWREGDYKKKLEYALVKGTTEYLSEDIMEALSDLKLAVKVIEGPLMAGMDKVGAMFGEGKMFLPQVVKSAKVIKNAVEILQPYIKEQGVVQGVAGRDKIVLATVKGDVHDIGKNIVSIVLGCNNFEIIDLGVMVDIKDIVDAAIDSKATFIGASGLITPSLVQMELLCQMLQERKDEMLSKVGHLIPVVVGGATVSSVYVAVKLSPIYDGCVIYGGDASRTALLCKKWSTAAQNGELAQFEQEIKQEHLNIANLYNSRANENLTPSQARELSQVFLPDSFIQAPGFGENNFLAKDVNIGELVQWVDWTSFLNFWGFKGTYSSIVYGEDEKKAGEAEKLYEQATGLLASAVVGGEYKAQALVEFYDAVATVKDDKDVIVLFENVKTTLEQELDGSAEKKIEAAEVNLEGRKVIGEFEMPRQLKKGSGYKCIADYFPYYGVCGHREAPSRGKKVSKIGVFVVKVEDLKLGEYDPKSFEYLLRYSVCARLTDALATWMDSKVSMGQSMIRPAFGYPACPDHKLKKVAFDILGAQEKIGVQLTQSYAIIPTTVICGLIVVHPAAEYFGV
ncbi:MAG: methionine synthase [Bacteroidia bacterium]|nr:methionine synthase [Bacteroidia bacterium]